MAAENMSFHGLLLDTVPCDINGGSSLSVEFGEVGINRIDGTRYMQKMSFPVNCPGGFDMPFKMVYQGEVSDFDPAALKASPDGLGIKLRRQCNGHEYCDVEVGGYIPVSMMDLESQLMNFQSVPVKRQGAELEAGLFSASASFRLEYY